VDYICYISTPARTLKSAPVKTTLKLSRGRLTGGFLYFPRGPAGYLHFQAFVSSWQILPYNKDQSYQLNGCVIPLYLNIDFFEPPFLIDFITWNDSPDYVHAMSVGIFLDPYAHPRKGKNFINSAVNAVSGYLKGGDRKS